jgi:hypothetical protein
MIGVHLLTFLQARGLGLAGAVALGALVGPSQVGARVIEMAFGRHYHPIWTMAASVVLVAGGIWLLVAGFPILAPALALYGAGNGIGSIAKGTLPSPRSDRKDMRRSWVSWRCRACSRRRSRPRSGRS